VLDSDEDALAPRLLCAGLHLAAAQPVLALLQYETLLPLAVGQGEFFAAIAVQKRLDMLHPTSVTHAKRYEVLRRWFVSLGRNKRVMPGERPGELSEAALLDLDPASFTRVLEACKVEGLDPDPRTLTEGLDACRVVLFGRTGWSLAVNEDVVLLEGLAEAGQTIAVDPGLGPGVRLVLTSELPSEMLWFGADALEALRVGAATAAKPVPAAPAAVPRPAPRPAVPARPAPIEPHVPTARPRPDPRFEPVSASGAPIERRRGSRVAINLASGVARLGLTDTRVAPIGGRVGRVEPERLELIFQRSDLRHLRTRLEGSCLGLQFQLGPEQPPLICTGRVRWTSALGAGPDATELNIEIEILPLRSTDRDRFVAALEPPASGPAEGPATRAA